MIHNGAPNYDGQDKNRTPPPYFEECLLKRKQNELKKEERTKKKEKPNNKEERDRASSDLPKPLTYLSSFMLGIGLLKVIWQT